MKRIEFDHLPTSDLLLDALYSGGSLGNAGDDPLSRLMGTGNQGGFRYVGSAPDIKLCVLYSSQVEYDWPDTLDLESGLFTYFGDNRTPGYELHDTRRKGNIILREVFNNLHAGLRDRVPPIFVFTKGPHGRDVVFRGWAAPGGHGISHNDDLVAIWKTKDGNRFQNYRAIFTILDVASISREWIVDIHAGNPRSNASPQTWSNWVDEGSYTPLTAPPTGYSGLILPPVPE